MPLPTPTLPNGNEVYIVLRNGKPDAVFSNEAAAANHAKNITRRWGIPKIIPMEVQEL